jgi:hypothetical protein
LIFTKTFDYDGWYGRILILPFYWTNLKFYVYNKNAKTAYIDSQEKAIISVIIDKEKGVNKVSTIDFDTHKHKEIFLDPIEEAFLHYTNQMVVIFSTYLELIIKEFIEVFFYYKSGYKKSVKGGTRAKIKEIEKICKISFNEKLKNEIHILIDSRNKIVHENIVYRDITIDLISESILTLLKELRRILKKNKIPVTE